MLYKDFANLEENIRVGVSFSILLEARGWGLVFHIVKKFKLYGPFHGRGSTASRLQSHYEEAVYFLLLSSKKYHVLYVIIMSRMRFRVNLHSIIA